MVSREALDKHVTEHTYMPTKDTRDLDLALAKILPHISNLLHQKLEMSTAINFQLKVKLSLEKFSFVTEKMHCVDAFFTSRGKVILNESQITQAVGKAANEIILRFDSFVQEGSGWFLTEVIEIIAVVNKYRLIRGGCLKTHLPEDLLDSRAILCPKNISGENQCFIYALALALSYSSKKKNPSRLDLRDKRFIRSMIGKIDKFPVDLKTLVRFEKNCSKFSINVYGFQYEGKVHHIFPYYISPFVEKRSKHANLLLHKGHFFAISNLSPLVKKNVLKNKRKSYICNFCLSISKNREKFELHKTLCHHDGKLYRFPTKKIFQKFSNFKNLLPAPFVIYIDLESRNKPKENISRGKQISKTEHECISWACLTVCRPNPNFNSGPVMYTGNNAISELLKYLETERKRVLRILKNAKEPIDMEDEDIFQHLETDHCEICQKFYFDDKLFPEAKMRDHCHLSGKYRFALCNACNLKHAVYKKEIICIFHGLSNYDSHFIIQELQRFRSSILKVIPKSSEKFMSFSVGELVFKDSFNFLSERLQILAENLQKKGDSNFQNVNRYVKSKNKRKILCSKGVFPYSYITTVSKLMETSLPPKAAFFNDLTQTDITDTEYETAKRVWEEFSCKTLKDYLHVYLLADILILADVFENFRTISIKDYELDPCHYFSGAHFTMDAYLRKTGQELELLRDVDMYLLFSNCIRGGLSMVCKRSSYANNKYLANFDQEKPSKYILYIDANNLYGHAMRNKLPFKDFQWCDVTDKQLISKILNSSINTTMMFEAECETTGRSNINEESEETGYLLEVDLEYPEELHDIHSDFPLAPEKISRKFSELSPFAQYLCDKLDLQGSTNNTKLVATLENKYRYTIYYKNLILYLKLGLKLKKVHKILSFTETHIMKQYIDFNSKKRAAASNSFDINFYKFLSNSLFGKTMERPDNRTILKLVSDIQTYEKYVSQLNFKQTKIINKDLVSLELNHPAFVIKKPFYIGAIILELAKFHMVNFHYNVMKKHFQDRIRLLYTDTDSFIYEISCEDIFTELSDLKQYFDFSNFPKDHLLFDLSCKKVPGFFKDECSSKQLKAFIGLRSKMYALKNDDETELKTAKGIKKYVIDQKLRFKDYEQCLLNSEQMEHEFLSIKSKAHQVFTSQQFKVSLSPFDDKRWLLNSFDSLPYGHKDIIKHSI